MSGPRRRLLVGALAAAGGYAVLGHGLPALMASRRGIEFAPLDRPAGFRRIAGGARSTGAFDPFAGLDGPAGGRGRGDGDGIGAELCATLFAGWPGAAAGVPIASFSDYNCPICRVTTRRLAGLREVEEGRAHLTWHELPILGETSLLAARAALAADRQGAYAAFHDRLLRSPFEPTRGYLAAVADDLGLDAGRLAADMASDAVEERIGDALALRDLFGFAGTPAIVVGRTVVEGDVDARTLSRLIAIEREAGPPPGCPGGQLISAS
ncbi:MAG: DsbA family protein [Hasllibacter sp.]